MTERELQTTVAEYFWRCLALLPAGPYWFAVEPLPVKKTARQGAIAKAMGQKPPPDFILCWRGRFIGVELKTARGRLSEAQKRAHEEIQLTGGVVEVCRSLDDVINLLEVAGIPIIGRVNPIPRARGGGAKGSPVARCRWR